MVVTDPCPGSPNRLVLGRHRHTSQPDYREERLPSRATRVLGTSDRPGLIRLLCSSSRGSYVVS